MTTRTTHHSPGTPHSPNQTLFELIQSRGYKLYNHPEFGESQSVLDQGLEKIRRIWLETMCDPVNQANSPHKIIFQLEVTRWGDEDVTGYLGSVGNYLDDNDESWDDLDAIGISPEQVLYTLIKLVPDASN